MLYTGLDIRAERSVQVGSNHHCGSAGELWKWSGSWTSLKKKTGSDPQKKRVRIRPNRIYFYSILIIIVNIVFFFLFLVSILDKAGLVNVLRYAGLSGSLSRLISGSKALIASGYPDIQTSKSDPISCQSHDGRIRNQIPACSSWMPLSVLKYDKAGHENYCNSTHTHTSTD